MTEEELVEKVARAIIGPYTKPHESPLTWEHCKAQARAAIAAMREAMETLAAEQKELPPDFKKALYSNLHKLYADGDT